MNGDIRLIDTSYMQKLFKTMKREEQQKYYEARERRKDERTMKNYY